MLCVQRSFARRVRRVTSLHRVAPHRHASQARNSTKFDQETDVIICGSGGAGLVAALRCSALSLRSIVLEKTDKIGGTTALSGGGMWIPNNPYHRAAGEEDSLDTALEYMDHCIGEAGPASSARRRLAFVQHAPRMLDFLLETGFQGRASGRYPNYYPDLPGGHVKRSVESALFDTRKLGREWRALVRRGADYPPVHTDEASRLFRSATSLSNMLYAAKILGLRGLGRKALGQLPVTMGPALVCQLLHLNLLQKQQRGERFDLWRNSPLMDLILDDRGQNVIGAVVHHGPEKQPVRIRARRGVLLVAGGFARNLQMRQQHQEGPVSDAWTSAQEGDMGDAIRIGTKSTAMHGIEAQVALMDDAWWGPSAVDPRSGQRFFLVYERALPHSIIVDGGGDRFMNEAQSYTDACHAMFERNRTVPAIPAWIILDASHRRKYPFASLLPGLTPNSALNSGFAYKGATLHDLAGKIGVPPARLDATVERFNAMARRGKDEDFGRGGNEYDRFFADEKVKPNGNLGPIETAPFYAFKVYPGDLGTKGGLLTDENSQVINTRGDPVAGLYAAGNTTASVMGRSYPGPGSTLGPALTFSYIAVNHMARGVPTPS